MSQNVPEEKVIEIAKLCRLVAPKIVKIFEKISIAVKLGEVGIDNTQEVREVEVAMFDALMEIGESDFL